MDAKACSAIADRNGDTPLHIACHQGDEECTFELLQEIKDTNQKFTLLHQDYEEFNIGGKQLLRLDYWNC